MGTRITLTSLVMAITVVVAQGAWAQLIIDDFSTGTCRLHHTTPQVTECHRRGNMVGGDRNTEFTTIIDNTHGDLKSWGTLLLAHRGVNALNVGLGIRLFHKVQVLYGWDNAINQFDPMNLLLTPYDRFRVTFDASDLVLNFVMEVIAGNNPAPGILGANLSPSQTPFPFCVDFLFTGFVPNAGAPPDFGDIDAILLIIQSAGAIGAQDYAIRSVEAVFETGVSPCFVVSS